MNTIYSVMDAEEVESRIRGQLFRQWKPLLGFHMTAEDIINQVHLGLLQQNFDQDKWTDKMFITVAIRGELGHVNRHLRTKMNIPLRYNTVYETDEGSTYAYEMEADYASPEDYLMAKEAGLIIAEQNIREAVVWGQKLNKDLL